MQFSLRTKTVISVSVFAFLFFVSTVVVAGGSNSKIQKLAKVFTPKTNTAEAAPSYGYKGYSYIYSSDSTYNPETKVWNTWFNYATNQTNSGSIVRYKVVKAGSVEFKTERTVVASNIQASGAFLDTLQPNSVYDYYFYSRANGLGTLLTSYRYFANNAPTPSYGYQNPRVFKYVDGSPSNVISGTNNLALIKFVVHAPTNSDLDLGYLHFNFSGNTSTALKSVRLHELNGKMVSPNYTQVTGSFLELSLTNQTIPKGTSRIYELLATVNASTQASLITTSLVKAYTPTYQTNFEYLPISHQVAIENIQPPVVPTLRIEGTNTVVQGKTSQYRVFYDQDGAGANYGEVDVTYKAIWGSKNPSIVNQVLAANGTYSAGFYFGISKGSTDISATYNEKTVLFPVTVVNQELNAPVPPRSISRTIR